MFHSIRRRLLLILLSASIGLWLLAAVFSYLDTRIEVEKLFDAQLAQSGRVMLALSMHEVMEQRLLGKLSGTVTETIREGIWQLGHNYEKKLAFQIWINDDILAMRSDNAPDVHMTRSVEGFSEELVGGNTWRMFTLQSEDGDITIHIGEMNDIRHKLANGVVMRTLAPMIMILPLTGFVLWYGVGQAISPLRRIAEEMRNRRANDLRHIDADYLPDEAKTLAASLNNVFDQLQSAVETERRFTADAAHELRTPLAALKTHAEVALQAATEEEKKQALRQVVRGVDRATRLVEQLLTLARLDPDTGKANVKRFDLFIVAEQVISDEAAIAIEKDIEISLNGTRGKFVHCNGDAVAVMMRNLIDNAIRYTPEGGVVEVSIIRFDDKITFRVSDSGPGIPAEDRERIFQRFYRRLGTKSPGSGLGLSIVSRIIDLYGLNITLDEAVLGGLQIDVQFKAMDLEPRT
ncbi:MAG: ATP-binding protein [Gammaproteobacteria bacterium]|nr:ATP-binding protein [Gammaproteobacteria bacterium]